MKWETSAKEVQLRFYDSHPDNYRAGCIFHIYGNRAYMWNIWGNNFYKYVVSELMGIMESIGVDTLEGYVTRVHARLFKRAFRHSGFTITETAGACAGRDMMWLVMTAPGVTTDPAVDLKTEPVVVDHPSSHHYWRRRALAAEHLGSQTDARERWLRKRVEGFAKFVDNIGVVVPEEFMNLFK